MTMRCRRCNTEMVPGQALVPTVRVGMPDFAGQADIAGQTFTQDGPAEVRSVMKCPDCGHSIDLRGVDNA
jgi:hypothetical protein